MSPLLNGISEKRFLEKLKSRKWRLQFMSGAISQSLAISVKENRKARGWTQAELGKIAKIRQPRIALLETKKGMERVTLTTLLKLAKAFDCALIVQFTAWEDRDNIQGFLSWVLAFTIEGCIVKRFPEQPPRQRV